jgi:hypothetical protein
MAATSGTPPRRGGVAARLAAVTAVGLMATACGAPNVAGPAASSLAPAASPVGGSTGVSGASPAPTGPFAPLTGAPVSAARARQPAVAVAIAGAHPTGLTQADVVYEEISTPVRYLAVYQSRQSSDAGPVTSTRPADGMIASVLHASVGYSGGTEGFLDVLHHQDVTDLGADSHPTLYHSGPGGLTANTGQLQRAHTSQPPDLFPFRGEGLTDSHQLASRGVSRAASARIKIPGQPAQRWRYDPAAKCWRPTAGAPSVCDANLVIQNVAYKEVYLSHRTGIVAPSARVFGGGKAVVLSNTAATTASGAAGLAVHTSWTKPGAADLTNFIDADGSPVEFAPGRTWVILAPVGTHITTRGTA